jgi:ribonuclease HII
MRGEPPGGKFRCEGALESELRARGFRAVAGADEVGRGSLFGPVVAAAVILSPDRPIRGLNDSKLLDHERRVVLAERIRARAQAWAIAAVDAATIDLINIYQASRLAMKMAVERLSPPPDFILIDALPLDLGLPQRPIVHGDARCHSIAAASIIAKVYRDACMCAWDAVFPEYGLARHKGYTAPEHLNALEALGPTPLHRLSFEPVRFRSLFPVDYDPEADRQMELFEAEGAACP